MPRNDDAQMLFSYDYPPNDGGIARLCAEIVNGFAQRGPVSVFSQLREGDSIVPAGVVEHRVTGRRPLRELAAWWHLVRDRRLSTVIVGTWYPEGLIALLAGKRDLVVLAHGAELASPGQSWRRPLWRWMQRWTLERARLVVANSHYTAEMVSASAPTANVWAIPLAVDHERFAPGDRSAARASLGVDSDTMVIGTVTRIHAFKGIDVVLRAIAALPSDQRERLVYLVGGKGGALDDLKRLACELGIEENVRWLGFVPEADLPDLYRAMDLFALCTRELLSERSVEGFGMVFLEAQACGTAAVGTRTGGIPDAIHEGEGGWLIAQDDVAALARLLGELVDDPDALAEQGQRARVRVEREATWDHYLAAFTAAIGERSDG